MVDYLKAVNRDDADIVTLKDGTAVEAGGKSHIVGWIGHLLICLLGDFNKQQPTPAQLETLKNLVRWGLTTYHLTEDTVKTHRDYAHTDCPGDNLYRIVHDGAFLR